MLESLPKAELHVHLDGAITPAMIKSIGKRNNIQVSDKIFTQDGKHFYWTDFSDFHKVFEESFKVIQHADDYYEIMFAYLKHLAEQNTLYAEIIVSPYHAGLNQTKYSDMLDGIVRAIDDARDQFGIEGRILMVFLRHYGPAAAKKTMDEILDNLHPYVVGVNLVGDIRQHEVKEFEKVFDMARAAGLGLTCHAGEIDGGPKEIWQAIDVLGATRIGHGVSCVEDPALMKELVKRGTVLEVCPSSNIILKMYESYAAHPLKAIHDAGVKFCINTDDPAFFDTTLANEYELAKEHYGFDHATLLETTKTAIEAAFVDKKTKDQLLSQC